MFVFFFLTPVLSAAGACHLSMSSLVCFYLSPAIYIFLSFFYISSVLSAAATYLPFAAPGACRLSVCLHFRSSACLLYFLSAYVYCCDLSSVSCTCPCAACLLRLIIRLLLLVPVTCPYAPLSCHLSTCYSFLSPVHAHAALSCHLSTCCSFLSPVRMLLFPVTCPHVALSCHLSTFCSFLSPVHMLIFPVTGPHAALSCHLSACCSFLSLVHMLLFPVTCPCAALSCHLSTNCSFLPSLHKLLFPVTCPYAALSCHLSACCSFLSPVRVLLYPVTCLVAGAA